MRLLCLLTLVALFSCLPGCFQPVSRLDYATEPEAEPDTALALQRRLNRALDSLDGVPRGCVRDSTGVSCPDLKPPGAP